jgi:hypothetical protein
MDIQVIYLRDVLAVSQVTNIQGAVPRTLDVRGPDFRSVIRVEINEETSPSFIVASKTRMLVQVPSDQEKEVIRSIAVLSNDFTKTVASQIKFEFTTNPRSVSGLKKLIQTFLLYLLRTPGTDAWYPKSGGGLQKLIGSQFSRSNAGGVTASFSTAVNRTKSQIISLQASNPRLIPSERLASADVLSASFNVNLTALLARIHLVSQSGESAAVGLEL